MKVLLILVLVGLTLAQKGGKSPGGKGPGGKDGWTPPPGWTPKGGNGGGKGGNGGNGGGNSGTTPTPVDPDEKPESPTLCNSANQGRCECGDQSQGFTTYTFWQNDQQRCFTIYHPLNLADQALPVVFSPNCYATDKLMSLQMTNSNTEN